MGSLRSLRSEAKEKELSRHGPVFLQADEVLQVTLAQDGRLMLCVLPAYEYPPHWNKGKKRTGGKSANTSDIRIVVKDETETNPRLLLTLENLTHVGMEHANG